MPAFRLGLLGRLRIARKLGVMLAIGVAAIAALAAVAVHNERRVMLDDRIAATQHLVETAHSIAALQYERAQHGELSDEAARAAAMGEIKALRYGANDYFWINDMQPSMLMHPFKPEMVGKNLSGFADANGVKLFDEMIARVKQSGAGYVEYVWPKPGASAPVRKISYVKGFAPWGWVIGSGIYVDDVDAAVSREAIVLGGIAAAVALLMALISHLIARSVVGPMKEAVQFAQSIANGELGNRIETDARDESGDLVRALDAMQAKLARQIGDLETVLGENRLICETMDNLETMVRIADHDGKVLYANRALLRLLKEVEPHIQGFRPEFKAETFVGGNIGDIYPDAGAAVERMRAITQTTRVRAPNYNRVIDFVYSPIFDAAGRQRGTVAEWVDVTAQVRVEKQLVELVERAGHGDFSQRLELNDKEGVLLSLSKGINELLGLVETTLGEIGRVLGALSSGDLRQSIQGEFEGMLGQLRDDANETVRQLATIVAQIKSTSEGIHAAARDIAADTKNVAAQTEQQAANLEETASSMEELTSTVKQNADNARQANQLAASATDVAQKGGKVVAEVVKTMSTISESSRKIVDIIAVIDGIAFQTNILALNAAVEAARAGEQGRGFAVVASEVRNLAQRSANAAKEIKTLIGDSVDKVDGGAKLVQQAGTTMQEIVASIKRVSDIMGEISAASQEQSSGIEQVNSTIAQMDESTQQNAALVEDTSTAARQLSEQAEALSGAVARFKLADASAPAKVAALPARTPKAKAPDAAAA